MILVELLDTKPMSGDYPERYYGRTGRINTWVRFEPSGADAWVGVFPNGSVAYYSAAVPFGDGRHVLVIAQGQGYLVDGITGGLVRETPWSYSYSAVTVPDQPFVAVADVRAIWTTSLQSDRYAVLEKPWFTRLDGRGDPMPPTQEDRERVALDGIVFGDVDGRQLAGHVWWPNGWYAFTLEFASWQMIQTGPVASEWDAFQAQPGRGGFPTSQAYYDWMSRYWLS
jgi:hypothetical protein